MNDLVDLLDAGHRLVLARDRPSSVNPVCQRGVENLVDQSRLARTTHSRDDDELTQREGDIHVLQIVLTSALDDQLPSGSGTSARRQRDDERVTEIPQPDKGVDETAVVALVQTDGGLVEDVEHTDQSRTNLGGQSDALGLTARQ